MKRAREAPRDPPSVVVVGSVNVDLVIQVPHLPEEGETVAGGRFTRTLGGKGANQAAAAAKLGARVWLVGYTGDDEFGREAREDIESYGVDVSTLNYSSGPTGVAAILVDESGRNMIAVAPGANRDLTGDEVLDRLSQVPEENVVVIANLEVPEDAVAAAAEAAEQRGWAFILNPAPARLLPSGLLAHCDVITPNEHELKTLGSIEDLLRQGAGAVIVTRGKDGADLYRSNLETVHRPSLEVEAVDSTGAGDAFNGTLAWSLARGDAIEQAVGWAAAAGALACQSLGARAGLADRDELERAVSALAGAHNHPFASSGDRNPADPMTKTYEEGTNRLEANSS